ncbi:39S ribosomal protein L23, mitochondrial [Acipenser ruthenus]|uniref:Large ribosomal subunit protein uL23m n=1 Tax=Acipenser ruthenus TaxID=7906 RepID=A0A444UKC4_ACIRT|nr:39S ribosomal protein L23, mitochondrial [Acipenser ruthenus]
MCLSVPLPRYPLYQLGNPQLRIFRTNFFMTLVKPGKEQPPDTVQFRIPMEMTKCDVKNYLEKIYSVPVGAVRTRIQYFKTDRAMLTSYLAIRFPKALSSLPGLQAQQQTFQFPEIFPQKDTALEPGSVEEMQDQFMQDEQQRQKADPRRGGVTEWFGL